MIKTLKIKEIYEKTIENINRKKQVILNFIQIIGIATGLYYITNSHIETKYRKLVNENFFERLKYLTNIAQLITIILLIFLLIPRDIRFIDILLPFSCSLNFLVTLLYWGLYLYDPNTMYSEKLLRSGFKPKLFGNLCGHGFPYLNTLFNTFFKFKGRNNYVIGIIASFSVSYMIYISIINYYTDSWPYPFIKHLNLIEFMALFFVSGLIVGLHYELLCFLIMRYSKYK